jgi:hypothetical protein
MGQKFTKMRNWSEIFLGTHVAFNSYQDIRRKWQLAAKRKIFYGKV